MPKGEVLLCHDCDRLCPVEDIISFGDAPQCRACWTHWREYFDECAHDWSTDLARDDHGNNGRFCPRCLGFVSEDNAMALFPLICDGYVEVPDA